MATEAVDDHCSFDLDTVAVVVAGVVVVADIVAVAVAKVAVVVAKVAVAVVANAEHVAVVVQRRLDSVDVSEYFRSLAQAETTTAEHLIV